MSASDPAVKSGLGSVTVSSYAADIPIMCTPELSTASIMRDRAGAGVICEYVDVGDNILRSDYACGRL